MRIRNHRSAPALLALLATLAVATTGQSQASSPARKGFFVSGSLAYGTADLTGSGFSLNSEFKTGLAGYLGLGGTFSPHWRLSFQIDAYTKASQGSTLTMAFYSGAVSFYPSLGNNFWIKGSLGMANVSVDGGGASTSESGFAGGLGIGFDWLPGHGKFAIIPYASYNAQLSGAEFDQLPGFPVKGSLFQIGVGIGYKH